jgi:hypothetical protein
MKGRDWILVIATLLALGGGAAYLWKWQGGWRGAELLGFSCWAVCPALVVSLILLFVYFQYAKR